MARTVTGTIYHEYGSAWASGTVTFTLLDTFVTATKVYPIEEYSVTTNASGQFSISLGTPDTGTAHYQVQLPNRERYEFYVETGTSVDLTTLITIAGTAVAQDDLQTLMDQAKALTIANPTTTYVMDGTKNYIRCNGTFLVTLPANATGSGISYLIANIGTGNITVVGSSPDTIAGLSSVTIAASQRYSFIDGAAGRWDV